MSKILAVTRVYGKGKTQIPREARQFLKLNPNNDYVVWLQEAGTVFILKRTVQGPTRAD
jgi:bifunctional DNA-binding transcriptional regulator/antitoxin component of YhaV-PrlF toxin-antitoxin module